MHPPIPKRIGYMKPFIRYLESLPPDELNEDVDPALLEEALRKRLSQGDPESTLDADRQALEDWLESFDSNAHPAHWISGFLFSATAAELLEDPPDVEHELPRIAVEAPPGWSLSENGFELRKGELFAVILPIDESTYRSLQQQLGVSLPATPPLVQHREAFPVTFGEVTGYKYIYQLSSPRPWKQIDYLLTVAGGFVTIKVCAMGADFDEQELEPSLHTLSIIQPPA